MRLNNLQLKKNNLNLSNELDKERIPEHIAIIMDGNGRWATKKGLPRSFGHNKGVSVLKEIIKVSKSCLLYTSPSPRDRQKSRMPSSA